jgi:hypothetical protein
VVPTHIAELHHREQKVDVALAVEALQLRRRELSHLAQRRVDEASVVRKHAEGREGRDGGNVLRRRSDAAGR